VNRIRPNWHRAARKPTRRIADLRRVGLICS
jgi:hypothetical protein